MSTAALRWPLATRDFEKFQLRNIGKAKRLGCKMFRNGTVVIRYHLCLSSRMPSCANHGSFPSTRRFHSAPPLLRSFCTIQADFLRSILPVRRPKEPRRPTRIRIGNPDGCILVISVIFCNRHAPPARHGGIGEVEREDNDDCADCETHCVPLLSAKPSNRKGGNT